MRRHVRELAASLGALTENDVRTTFEVVAAACHLELHDAGVELAREREIIEVHNIIKR